MNVKILLNKKKREEKHLNEKQVNNRMMNKNFDNFFGHEIKQNSLK